MKLLSICILTLNDRIEYLNSILKQIDNQVNDYNEIEVIYIGECRKTTKKNCKNSHRTIGEKRNYLKAIAKGKYIIMIDDDDRISPDYVSELLDIIKTKYYDCITFNSLYTCKNYEKIVRYDLKYKFDLTTETHFERMPDQKCCIKRELIENIMFPHISWGEDSAFARAINPVIKTHYHINKTLYYHDDF